MDQVCGKDGLGTEWKFTVWYLALKFANRQINLRKPNMSALP
jgi:hypothetical protein